MRTTTFTALTAKAVAGIAAATIAAGSAGTVLVTQTVGDDRPAELTAAEETTTTTEAEETTTTTAAETTTTTEATTTTTEAPDGSTTTTTEVEDEAEDAKEHPENFGAIVSADAKDGGVDGQEIAEAAHAKNAERKGSRPHPATQPSTPDDDSDDDDEADDDTAAAGAGRGRK